MAESFSEVVFVRCTPGVKGAIDEAASRNGTKPTHYAREAILARLRADGINPTPKTAGVDLLNQRGA